MVGSMAGPAIGGQFRQVLRDEVASDCMSLASPYLARMRLFFGLCSSSQSPSASINGGT